MKGGGERKEIMKQRKRLMLKIIIKEDIIEIKEIGFIYGRCSGELGKGLEIWSLGQILVKIFKVYR